MNIHRIIREQDLILRAMEKGKAEEKKDNAKEMLREGLSIEMISRILKLSEEEVKQLEEET